MQQPPESAGDLREELRGDAQKLTSTAADRLQSEADARKGPAVEQARSVASALNKAAEDLGGGQSPSWLKSLFEQGAEQIQRLADTVEQKDSRQLMSDLRQIARDNPTTFLATCAAAGFAASRIFRAEPKAPSSQSFSAPQGGWSEPPNPSTGAF
ncbi:MAG TPA: hypothetical protein VN110_03430 [Sphingobium sp.]|nr:hypothetical protein [Sphingobium sp.]